MDTIVVASDAGLKMTWPDGYEGAVAFSFQGKSFTANGSLVTEEHCVAYLAPKGALTSCNGEVIGSYRIVSSWPTPRSFVSSRYYQVVACIAGRTYKGRSAGVGMVLRGRRAATERRTLDKECN